MRKFVCIVVVILLTFVHQSKADITAITCTVGDDANGDKKCQDQDSNAECPGTATTSSNCACKADYFLSSDKTKCLQSIEEIKCTPTDGNKKCETQAPNTECPTGSSTCKCKADHFLSFNKKQCVQSIEEITCTPDTAGKTKCETQAQNAECKSSGTTCACKAEFYLSSDKKTCKQKISAVTCTPDHATEGDTKCQQVNANSECKTGGTMCGCKKGYTGTDSCTKIIGETCPASGDCSGSVENSVCTDQKCECGTNFIEENAVCKTALGQACTGTGQGSCVSNAECKDETCKCSSGFKDTNGLCAAESSATSAWMTTSLIITSLLIFLPRLICG